MVDFHTGGSEQALIEWQAQDDLKGLFTRKEGYPNKGVNPSWRAKDSPRFQAKFHR